MSEDLRPKETNPIFKEIVEQCPTWDDVTCVAGKSPLTPYGELEHIKRLRAAGWKAPEEWSILALDERAAQFSAEGHEKENNILEGKIMQLEDEIKRLKDDMLRLIETVNTQAVRLESSDDGWIIEISELLLAATGKIKYN